MEDPSVERGLGLMLIFMYVICGFVIGSVFVGGHYGWYEGYILLVDVFVVVFGFWFFKYLLDKDV